MVDVIVHQGWKENKDTLNDIALLELAEEVAIRVLYCVLHSTQYCTIHYTTGICSKTLLVIARRYHITINAENQTSDNMLCGF